MEASSSARSHVSMDLGPDWDSDSDYTYASTSSSLSSSIRRRRGSAGSSSCGGHNDPRSPSPTSLFEDSLFALFSHNQPARGNPGDVRTFTHPNLPPRYLSARREDANATGPGAVQRIEPDGSASDRATEPRSRRRRTPTRIRYRIAHNDGTNTKLFAHHQWDAGLYLAEMIADQSHPLPRRGASPCKEQHPTVGSDASRGGTTHGNEKRSVGDVRNRTVVELGAGTGLPSLVAALMGAERTVVTDYPDETILANLRANLDLALCDPSAPRAALHDGPAPTRTGRGPLSPSFRTARARIAVQGLSWGDLHDEAQVLAHLAVSPADGSTPPPAHPDGYDVVLAADVLWLTSAHPLLCRTIRRLLRRDRSARCLLIAGFHTGRPAVTRFFRSLAAPTPAEGPDRIAPSEAERTATAAILPDWEAAFGGIWERGVDGSERGWTGAWVPRRGAVEPGRSSAEEGQADGERQDADEGEGMGDLSDRASWVVVASLRWADLV